MSLIKYHSDTTVNQNGSHVNKRFYELPEDLCNPSSCSCGYSEVTAVLSNTIHWAEWLCIGCGKHRGWIEKPATANRREAQNQLIDRLLGVTTGWERTFLEGLRKRRKRSPRQLEILTAIASEYSSEIGGDVS
jgi:hypothetical protein